MRWQLLGASIAAAVRDDRLAAEGAGWFVCLLSMMQFTCATSLFPSKVVPPHHQPQQLIGAAIVDKSPRSVEGRRHAFLVSGSTFLVFSGWISFEATIGVLTMSEYGWGVEDTAPLWLGMSLSSLVATLLFVDLRRRWSARQLAVLMQTLTTVGAALLVHWLSFSAGTVAWPQLLSGLVLMGIGCNLRCPMPPTPLCRIPSGVTFGANECGHFSMCHFPSVPSTYYALRSFNLHNMLLDAHLEARQRAQLMGLVQGCAQLGR